MAITVLSNLSVAAAVAASSDTQFVTTGPFVLYADYFAVGQNAILYRLGPSGDYLPATNREGTITLSAIPNMAYVESGGTFRVSKGATAANAVVGYEEA